MESNLTIGAWKERQRENDPLLPSKAQICFVQIPKHIHLCLHRSPDHGAKVLIRVSGHPSRSSILVSHQLITFPPPILFCFLRTNYTFGKRKPNCFYFLFFFFFPFHPVSFLLIEVFACYLGRGRFSGPEQSSSCVQNTESLKRDKGQNWFQKQLCRQMNWEHDSEFAAAVAAAAFAIYTLEEAEEEYRRKIRKEFEKSKTEVRTRKEDRSAGSVRVTRSSSTKEVKDAAELGHRAQDTFMPTRRPSRLASTRSMVSTDQREKANSTRSEVGESKVDSWEKAQLRKINKRYEKMKTKVLAWENEKKMEAKLHMERKKNELELRKSRNLQHYQINVERIDAIAGGAKAQVEEKRRSEEAEVKEKAKYMRRKGKNPVRCFCC